MRLRLRIAHRAPAEIERAEGWWVKNRPAAPAAFRADLNGAFILLLRQPGSGAKVGNTRLKWVPQTDYGNGVFGIVSHPADAAKTLPRI